MIKHKCDKNKCAEAAITGATILLFGWLAYSLYMPFVNYTWTF